MYLVIISGAVMTVFLCTYALTQDLQRDIFRGAGTDFLFCYSSHNIDENRRCLVGPGLFSN
jgi:hypothetical protein